MVDKFKTLESKLKISFGLLEKNIVELLERYSGIGVDINSGGSEVYICTGTPYPWKNLSRDGKLLQNNIRTEFYRTSGTLCSIITRLSPANKESVKDLIDTIAWQFEQCNISSGTCYPALSQAVAKVQESFGKLQMILNETPTHNKDFENNIIAVTDTCSLLNQHELHKWRFDDINRCILVIVPRVIAELDKHKDGNNENLKVKASSLIRQIKEFRSRGALSEGVKVNENMSVIIPLEDEIELPTTWLKCDNADDRILISVLQQACLNFRSDVRVVSRDTNVNNKLHLLGIEELEPVSLTV